MPELKQTLVGSPALRAIDYESGREIVLAVDSSVIGVGYILLQVGEDGRRYPNRFGSINWNERERNYSQAKLELYGLMRALRAVRIYIIGAKQLTVEVDAKYIKGMINNPDVQPNATINRWIQGILLFDFELIHVPAERHKGPDALSRKELGEGEVIDEEDDSWLDNIALLTYHPFHNPDDILHCKYDPLKVIPVYLTADSKQDLVMADIKKFLSTLECPMFDNL